MKALEPHHCLQLIRGNRAGFRRCGNLGLLFHKPLRSADIVPAVLHTADLPCFASTSLTALSVAACPLAYSTEPRLPNSQASVDSAIMRSISEISSVMVMPASRNLENPRSARLRRPMRYRLSGP